MAIWTPEPKRDEDGCECETDSCIHNWKLTPFGGQVGLEAEEGDDE